VAAHLLFVLFFYVVGEQPVQCEVWMYNQMILFETYPWLHSQGNFFHCLKQKQVLPLQNWHKFFLVCKYACSCVPKMLHKTVLRVNSKQKKLVGIQFAANESLCSILYCVCNIAQCLCAFYEAWMTWRKQITIMTKKVSSCRMAACDCQITSSHKTGNTKWVILKMISNLFKVQSKSLIESDSMPVSALHQTE